MKNQKGSGLIFATILLFVILSMVITLSSVTIMETKMSQKNKSSVGAFYNSESGIEWALNKIGNAPSGQSAHQAFSGFVDVGSGEVDCPDFGSGSSCKVYLLDNDGNIMKNADLNQDVTEVKAVRAVGSEDVGDTSRAIEAAVGATSQICYTDYSLGTGKAVGDSCGGGFTIIKSIGTWGYCHGSGINFYPAGLGPFHVPPGGNSPSSVNGFGGWSKYVQGEAYICCK